MVGQNGPAEPGGAKADHVVIEQELRIKAHAELIRAIRALTSTMHRRVVAEPGDGSS